MRLYYTQRTEDSRKEREMQRAVRYDKGTEENGRHWMNWEETNTERRHCIGNIIGKSLWVIKNVPFFPRAFSVIA